MKRYFVVYKGDSKLNDLSILFCRNCYTLYEVKTIEKSYGLLIGKLVDNLHTYYTVYDTILKPCCNKPYRTWLISVDKKEIFKKSRRIIIKTAIANVIPIDEVSNLLVALNI